jgi:hypothetical protein
MLFGRALVGDVLLQYSEGGSGSTKASYLRLSARSYPPKARVGLVEIRRRHAFGIGRRLWGVQQTSSFARHPKLAYPYF